MLAAFFFSFSLSLSLSSTYWFQDIVCLSQYIIWFADEEGAIILDRFSIPDAFESSLERTLFSALNIKSRGENENWGNRWVKDDEIIPVLWSSSISIAAEEEKMSGGCCRTSRVKVFCDPAPALTWSCDCGELETFLGSIISLCEKFALLLLAQCDGLSMSTFRWKSRSAVNRSNEEGPFQSGIV
jgi:hypothetical protein